MPDGPTVKDALGDLPALARFQSLYSRDEIELSEDRLAEMLQRQSDYVRRLNGVDRDPSDLSDARLWERRRLTSVGLAVHSQKVVERFRRLQRGARDEVGRLPKLDPERKSPTLRAGTGRDHGSFTSARPVHYSSPRVIAVREAARLHGFPDWFGFHTTKWHGFRQVGNAVPPPLARAVASAVTAAAGTPVARHRGKALKLGSDALLSMTLTEAAKRYDLEPTKLPANVRVIAARKSKEAA
jgi:DNA (cytosine-5)-methyltransferase 1